jgi:hypothetical protein
MGDIITCLLHCIYWKVKYTDEDISNMKYSSKIVKISKYLMDKYENKELDELLPVMIYMHKNNAINKHDFGYGSSENFLKWITNIFIIFDGLNGETKEYYSFKAEEFVLENL